MKKNLLILFLLILTACHQNTDNKKEHVIYTSFYPIYQLTEDIAGDTIEIRSFMPLHQDPHLWNPSPKDIRELEESNILIVNGAGIESWLPTIQKTLPNLKILDLSKKANLLYYVSKASQGDFQFLALADYSTENYKIDFGHTHEHHLRIGFLKKEKDWTEEELIKKEKDWTEEELIKKGLEIMNSTEEKIFEGDFISVEDEKLYEIEIDHDSEGISLKFPEEGEWFIYSDYAPSDLLNLTLFDSKGEIIDWNVLREKSTKGNENKSPDPHSWLSLENTKIYAEEIRSLLSDIYPENKKFYSKNTNNLIKRAEELNYKYNEKFQNITHHEFIVSNNAFHYIARDYHLIQHPLEGITSIEFPSLYTLKETLKFMEKNNLRTIFYEYGMPTLTAEILADELNGEIIPLISAEYITKKIEDNDFDFIDIMEFNLENLYKALR